MSEEVLIKAENVSKKFCRRLRKSLWYGLTDMAAEAVGGSRSHDELRPDEFWAVKDVSFELRRGECLGLIGHNGAGKTTLLKMLNGLIKPDHGSITMKGRVGALIALGAGFNPILTGRENIYVNASVLGLTRREVDDKIDEIIAFAEIGEFIDAPVQNYSSGMQVRLGFAVASSLAPDVLLLDEVLAVGDSRFRLKCYQRIDTLRKQAAVIFVSHDTGSIARICSSTLLLSRGAPRFHGATGEAIEQYVGDLHGAAVLSPDAMLNWPITGFEIVGMPNVAAYNRPLMFRVQVESEQAIETPTLRMNVLNMAGLHCASCIVDSSSFSIRITPGTNIWCVSLTSIPLRSGKYTMAFSVSGSDGELLAYSSRQQMIEIQGSHAGTVADCQLIISSWSQASSAVAPCLF